VRNLPYEGPSWTLKGYSHSTSHASRTSLLSSLNLTVVESAPSMEGVQLKEQPGWLHVPHCLSYKPVQRDHGTKLFINCLAGVQGRTGVCPRRWLNLLDSTWKFPLQILALGGVSCFEGCDWPPFWQVVRGADLATVIIPRVKEEVQLAEWLLNWHLACLGAEMPRSGGWPGEKIYLFMMSQWRYLDILNDITSPSWMRWYRGRWHTCIVMGMRF
jgi:hypothetical protein